MHSRCRMFSTLFILAISIALSTGCGGQNKRPPLAKVSGTVVYKGNPVAGASVSFMMDGAPRPAIGTTDDNGNFQLTTYDTDDGAVIGTHKVTVNLSNFDPDAPRVTPEDLAKNGPPPKPKGGTIPAKYADIKTTPLKNTVEPGPNNFPIELKD